MTPSAKTREGCRHRTKSGARCRAAPGPSGLCWAHDPKLAKKRAQACKNGGRKRAYENGPSATVATIEDVRLGLCEVVGRLKRQDNTVAVARALISGYAELRSTLEVGDIERRLAFLEELVASQGETRRLRRG